MVVKKFKLQPCFLQMDAPATVHEWSEVSTTICNLQRSVNWWIGDMMVYGLAQLGDDFYQAIDETFSQDLLARCEKVSRFWIPDDRAFTVSWSHHQLLTGYNLGIAKAILHRAEEERWNTQQLRAYLRDVE